MTPREGEREGSPQVKAGITPQESTGQSRGATVYVSTSDAPRRRRRACVDLGLGQGRSRRPRGRSVLVHGLEDLDVSGWVADKGYIGRGMITPPTKPAGKQLSDIAKKVSRSINRVRYIVEQVNAHIKTWKILKEDYRRPLNTFPQTITATLMLYTYTTTP